MSNGYPNTITADIVVVGAGMAGLYFAWRMLRYKADTNIAIPSIGQRRAAEHG